MTVEQMELAGSIATLLAIQDGVKDIEKQIEVLFKIIKDLREASSKEAK